MVLVNHFAGIIACLNFGKVLTGFDLFFEGTFGTGDQVIDRLLVGVLVVGNLDAVKLISGDLHTSHVNDDVSVVYVVCIV